MVIKDNKCIKIKQLHLITQETDKLPTAAPTVMSVPGVGGH